MYLSPCPSPACNIRCKFIFIGWRGELRREGAAPPLKFFPPLEQNKIRAIIIYLFERRIKGVSIENQL
jgi:hypothetical protein